MDNSSDKNSIFYASIQLISKLYRDKTLSPVELMKFLLARIEKLQPYYHCFTFIDPELALKKAKVSESQLLQGKIQGILHGIPIGIKDLLFTNDMPTSGGSYKLKNWIPSSNATVVDNLINSGALILGKLSMTEFGLTGYAEGFHPPVNPWNNKAWSGVSSSGSAVAAAVGLSFGTLGSDTGGSIRFPAACCGVVGMKPTFGKVSNYGTFPLAPTMDQIGPLTRSVLDSAILLKVISGCESKDPYSLNHSVPWYSKIDERKAGEIKIGIDVTYNSYKVQKEVRTAVNNTIKVFENLGFQIIEFNFPEIENALKAWPKICAAEAYRAHQSIKFPFPIQPGKCVQEFLEDGQNISQQQLTEFLNVRNKFKNNLNRVFEKIDLIVCPTMPVLPIPMDVFTEEGPSPEEVVWIDRFATPFNLSGNPAISIPCGFSQEVPIGFQLIGKYYEEDLLFKAAALYEEATDWHKKIPPLSF